MIPITLTLKNFMSYGDEPETLQFEGLHVACLSGDNGNGKSALLDAMTWVLWGKTRASSVKSISDDDLIRFGADEMEIRFVFALNDQTYRVVRKRRRGKASGSEWTLAQQDAEGSYIAIGGGSQRDTEKQIVQLLSMEYDTFLNSAYLQQGHADEFTRQTPDNRKRILAEVLDLDRYDRLEAKAKELARQRKESVDELEGQIRLLDAEIGRLPETETRLEQTRAALADMEQRAEAQEATAAVLNGQLSHLETLHTLAASHEANCQRLQSDIAQRGKELSDAEARMRQIEATLAQREAILGDYTRLTNARRRRDQLEPEIETYNRANTELRSVIGAIDAEKLRLQGDLRVLQIELKSVEQRGQECARLETQFATLAVSLKEEAKIASALEAAQTQLQAAQEAFAALKARNESFKRDIEDVDEVLHLLSGQRAVCPVCDSDLSGAKQQAVIARQNAKRAGYCLELENLKRDGAERKKQLTSAQSQVEDLTEKRDNLSAQKHQWQQAQARIADLRADGIDADAKRRAIEKLQTQIERGEFSAPQRVHRLRLESDIERLKLVRAEFETTTQTIQNLTASETRHHDLELAERNREGEAARRDQIARLVAERRKEYDAERGKRDVIAAKLGQYDDVKRETTEAKNEAARLQRELNSLRVAEGGLLKTLADGEQSAALRKQRDSDRKKADQERWLYNALAAAFGKKGVQTLIIENAIPELEDEANGLLSRITDNEMQVRFKTTRAARSASRAANSEIETLDIEITDDVGPRPYELFSGGEAFRVNFAIRIALSRLLARRSGAKLQTLIMDEGFGTQDGKGREKLVEVIETIKQDFDKILVITHVDELKDSFPQRIEITKDAAGSHIHLL